MPLAPREFAATLLAEARDTHPWLHHRLFRMVCAGELRGDQVRNVIREQGCFFLDTLYYEHMEVEEDHSERAVRILEQVAVTDAEQARGLLALRRAVAARRICADGMYEAFVGAA